jgi:hypothetical protein
MTTGQHHKIITNWTGEAADTPHMQAQVGMHGNAGNPTSTGLASGGPNSIVAAASDRKLRVLEDTRSGGLAVGQELDTGATLNHVIALGSGMEACCRACRCCLNHQGSGYGNASW